MPLTEAEAKSLKEQINHLQALLKQDEINPDCGAEQKSGPTKESANKPAGSEANAKESAAPGLRNSDRNDRGNGARLEGDDRSQGSPARLQLGTPPAGSGDSLTFESLGSKSIDWMSKNIDKVNQLVAGRV